MAGSPASTLRTLAWLAKETLFRPSHPTPLRPTAGRPILLLHGFAASSRVLLPLERHLRRTTERPVVRVDLGPGLRDLRQSGHRVHEALERVAASPGFEFVDVVAHSMGGLVAVYLLKALDRGRRIRRVITLGTPHGGTPVALAGVLVLGVLSRAVWQMLPRSPLIAELSRLKLPLGSEIVSIRAERDVFVPDRYSRIPRCRGQHNARVSGVDHIELLHSAPTLQLVTRSLARV